MLVKGEVRRKPYQTPHLKGLTFEQASLFLVWRAWNGDHSARELLRLLFPLPGEEPWDCADRPEATGVGSMNRRWMRTNPSHA